MIKNTMFVLAVLDLEKSASYYRDVLGFQIHEIGDPGWRLFEKDGARIMAGECPDAAPASDLGVHSYYGYFTVDDATGYYKDVTSKGAELVKELQDEAWGMREFGVRTIDGHRIMIGEELP